MMWGDSFEQQRVYGTFTDADSIDHMRSKDFIWQGLGRETRLTCGKRKPAEEIRRCRNQYPGFRQRCFLR